MANRIRMHENKDFLHMTAPDNWINDPNGLIYYNGYYHMFYQYFPYAPRWGTMHWGHAISKNLVDWEHLGIALYPSQRGDQSGCFSGSAVEHEGSLFLLYTGVRYVTPDPQDIHISADDMVSCQMLMKSADGFAFDNEQNKQMVIPPMEKPLGDTADCRDPKVWRGQNAWYMILATLGEEKRGKLMLLQSHDLQHWTVKNPCVRHSLTGRMAECPDYYEVKGQGILCYSEMGYANDGKKEPNQVILTTADFNEETGAFITGAKHQLLDYGMDLYATQSFLDEEGRRVQISWLRMPCPAKEGWMGQMSLPRVVSWENGHVYTDVHPNVRGAVSSYINIEESKMGNEQECGSCETLKPACGKELKLDPHGGPYRVEATLQTNGWINVCGYDIQYKKGRVITDRSRVFHPEHAAAWRMEHESPVLLDEDTSDIAEEVNLEIYVDEYIIEVYINRGRYVITDAIWELTGEFCWKNAKNIKVFKK